MKIGIGVLHYGEKSILNDLCKSLKVNRCVFDELIELDDTYVLYIHNDVDGKGFTESCNYVIKKLLSINCDWIWLLNNDVEVDHNTLKIMPRILSNLSNEIGIVGFQIRLYDNRNVIHHGGTYQCYPNGIHKSGSVHLNDLNVRTYERWVTFASVLLSREVINTIGLLDPNFKMIYSDSDYCYRARLYGFKIIYEPNLVIYHKVGLSGKEPTGKMKNIFLNDMLYFQNKWLNGKLFFDLDKQIY